MSEKLLVVEDAFVIGAVARGVLVMPKVTVEKPQRGTFRVRLVFSDGTAREVPASMDVSHVQGKLAPFAMYRLFEVNPEDVPVGTEVWSVDLPQI